MRTSERTVDAMQNYRVPSPSEMRDIVLDLSDLAANDHAMALDSLRDMIEANAELVKKMDAAVRERDEARAALDKYGQHIHSGPIASVCDLTMMDAYEPDRGFKVRGKWQTEKPVCTCGFDDAIGG